MNNHAARIRPDRLRSRGWLLLAAAVLVSQAGCATVTRGTTDEVWFESDPAGARVSLEPTTIDCITPCRQELKRKREYLVYFELEGYVPAQVRLSPKFAGAGAAGFAGNVILGGLVGMGVDHATGASKVLMPNPVRVTFVPVAAQPAPLPPRASGSTTTPTVVAQPAATLAEAPPAPPAELVAKCLQPALVDRETCLGRLRLGMTKAEAVALLGTPDGTSRDNMTYRYSDRYGAYYGDRFLKFDAADVVIAIGDKP